MRVVTKTDKNCTMHGHNMDTVDQDKCMMYLLNWKSGLLGRIANKDPRTRLYEEQVFFLNQTQKLLGEHRDLQKTEETSAEGCIDYLSSWKESLSDEIANGDPRALLFEEQMLFLEKYIGFLEGLNEKDNETFVVSEK